MHKSLESRSSMKTQPNNYSCGVYAVINALLTLGDEKSPKEVQELTGTDKNGTSENGILNALINFGYQPKEYKTNNKDNAWRWVLSNSIEHPLILIVENWEHWVVIAGRIKNKVIWIDSDPKNTVRILNKQELIELWGYRGYYGIRV